MNHVIFDETEEGLQIQIIDQEGQPMFASGRAEMLSATEKLLTRLGTSLAKLENRMVISGHTDAVPFTKATNYDNWNLSSDRAHATRRIFESAGVSEDRFIRVSGLAASDALRPEDPNHPSNRRVTIQLQYESAGMSDHAASGDGETMLHPSTSETKSVDTAGATKETQAEPDVVVSFENDVFTDLRNALR
jgi:chemotaxis protein MotB